MFLEPDATKVTSSSVTLEAHRNGFGMLELCFSRS